MIESLEEAIAFAKGEPNEVRVTYYVVRKGVRMRPDGVPEIFREAVSVEEMNGYERMIEQKNAEIERLKGDGVIGELRAENERLRTILRATADWLWHGLQSHSNMETYLRSQAGPPPPDGPSQKSRQVEVELIFRGRPSALPIENVDSF